MKNYFVYIIANKYNTVLYIGVTNDLHRRIYEHKNKLVDGFTKKYNLTKLVYYEQTSEINSAIAREKEINKWRREKKNQLIESLNPEWKDLLKEKNEEIYRSSKKDALVRNDRPEVIGLIISAGFSSRMGKFKPLLDFNNKSFLSSIIEKVKSVCANTIIVTGYKSDLIEKHILDNYSIDNQNIEIIYNPDYKKGMFTSIKKGIEKIVKSEWVFYHQVDQPNLSEKFYHEFVNQIDTKYDWIQPTFKGEKGHPIIFGREVINKVFLSNLNSNLRVVTDSSEIIKQYWDCNYPEILTDLDTPADLNKIKGEK